MMMLDVERHEKYNRTKAPCGHSFKVCISNFVAKDVGCRLLEDDNNSSLTRCKTLEEIRHFETIYTSFVQMTNEELTSLTGCLVPCSFMKYKVLQRHTLGPKSGFQLQYAAKDLRIVKEVRAVSEFM